MSTTEGFALDRETIALVGQRTVAGRREEHVADFEQREVGLALRDVELRRAEESRHEARAQERLLRPQRVLELDTLRLEPCPLQVGRGHERHRVGLVEAEAHEHVDHPAPFRITP